MSIRRRIIPLQQVESEVQHLTHNCFYCIDFNQPKKKVKAVVAVEVEILYSRSMFFGMCGNHAEFSPLTAEWSENGTLFDKKRGIEA